MGMFFESKEEKKIRLQKEVDVLNEKYKSIVNSYCKIHGYIFLFLGFELSDKGNIAIRLRDKSTVKGYDSIYDFFSFDLKYEETDLHKCRQNFINFRHDLKLVGLELTLSESNKNEK